MCFVGYNKSMSDKVYTNLSYDYTDFASALGDTESMLS